MWLSEMKYSNVSLLQLSLKLRLGEGCLVMSPWHRWLRMLMPSSEVYLVRVFPALICLKKSTLTTVCAEQSAL